MQLNGLSNVDARHAALWRESGTVMFAGSEHSEGGQVAETGREVASVSIEELVREHGRIDLLKIDIEGAEFEVLENADLSGVDAIVGELHVRDQRDQDRLVSHLEAAGFAVEVIPEEVMTSASKAPEALRRWGAVRGRSAMKAASIAYLLLPLDKGRLQTMRAPLFTAFRTRRTARNSR